MSLQEVLSKYNFVQLWNPILIIILLLIAFLYFKAFSKNSRMLQGNTVSRKMKTYFVFFLISFYFTFAGPLALLAKHSSFGAHMLQTSTLFLIVVPLLILGTPKWFIRPLFLTLNKNKIFRILNKPIVAILSFNMLWSFYHFPIVFDFGMKHMIFMEVSRLVILMFAFFMWFQIIPPIKEMANLKPVYKFAYIFAGGALITPACALLVFADDYFYTSYLNSHFITTAAGHLSDQKFGGAIMKIVQEVSYGFFLWYTFFEWIKQKKEHTVVDPVPITSYEENK